MGSLVGLAILAVAAAVVVPDLLRASRTSSSSSSGTSPTPVGANDPSLLALESQISSLALLVGSIAGRGTGAAAGAGVSGAESGISKGLGANPVPFAEAQQNVSNAYSSGVAGGGASGVNAGGFSGAAVGAFVTGLPGGIVEGAGEGANAIAAGPTWQNIFKWADSIGLPNFNSGKRLGT